MAKINGTNQYLFIINSSLTNESYIADELDMLKLIAKKELWKKKADIKMLNTKTGRIERIKDSQIIENARNYKDKISKKVYAYIINIWS